MSPSRDSPSVRRQVLVQLSGTFQSAVKDPRHRSGGELPEKTRTSYESGQELIARMVAEAEQRGANAIVAMRFDTSEIGTNWTEVCAYGTAVFAIPLAEGQPGAIGQSIQLTKAG